MVCSLLVFEARTAPQNCAKTRSCCDFVALRAPICSKIARVPISWEAGARRTAKCAKVVSRVVCSFLASPTKWCAVCWAQK